MKTREEPLLAILLKAFAILSVVGAGALLVMSVAADPAGGNLTVIKTTAWQSSAVQLAGGAITLWWMAFMVTVLDRIAVNTEAAQTATKTATKTAAARPVEAQRAAPEGKASKLRGGMDDEAGTWKIG
jgi:hypothetical protein